VQFCEAFGINQPIYSCSNCCSTAVSDSGTPDKSIPDNDTAGITETATLSSCPGTISKVLLYVDITHLSRGDISIDLTSPAGTTVDIKDTSGSFDDNVKGLYPETLTPSGSMSAFNGEDPSGDWSLKVADEDAFSTGDLNAWAVVATCN
jgi:subtilisin-like proprotein convertase family protein